MTRLHSSTAYMDGAVISAVHLVNREFIRMLVC